MRIMKTFAIILGALIALTTSAQNQVRWAHKLSPYRARFKIASQPSHAKSGYFLSVPICGFGDPDGRNVRLVSSKGRQIPVMPMGRTTNNCALVVAGGSHKDGDEIYAYWGAHSKATWTLMLPGLTVDIRTGKENGNIKDWDASEQIIKDSKRIGIVPVKTISLASNPIDSTDAIVMDFWGTLHVAKSETWRLFMASDDAGYLFINDPQSRKPVIDRSGRRWAHDDPHGKERRGYRMRKGMNTLRAVVIDVGGTQMAVLARWVSEKRKFVLPADAFVQSGTTELQSVEARVANKACPAFWTRMVSYLFIGPYVYTEYEVGTHSKQEVTWAVDNGMKGKSATFRQLVVSTKSMPISATSKDGATAKGLIQLGQIPNRVSWRHWQTYEAYSKLMNVQGVENLNPEYRKAYLYFHNLRERNPDAVRICEALLKDQDLRPAEEAKLQLNLARCATLREPAKSRKAYKWLATESKLTNAQALEYFEFELYRQRDKAAAAGVLKMIGKSWGRDSVDHARCVAELELVSGNVDKAKKLLEALRAKLLAKSKVTDAVLANNLVESYKQHVKTGYYEKAEGSLRKWAGLAPDAMTNGQYALLRTQYLRRIGWPQGAFDLLTKTIELNALASYLPDMELEKALLLRQMKRPKEAAELLKRIGKDYPNHPAAKTAKDLLQN